MTGPTADAIGGVVLVSAIFLLAGIIWLDWLVRPRR